MSVKKRLQSFAFATLVFLSTFSSLFGQTTILLEDFEDATVEYTTSQPECTDGFNDYFVRTDGTNINSNIVIGNIQGSFFFGANDIDGAPCTANPSTLSIEDICIEGYTNLQLCVFLAEDDDGTNQDWDASDFVHFNYIIDGGAIQNAIWVESVIPSGSNGEPAIDADFDGLGDIGSEINATLTQYCFNITSTGAELDIVVDFSLNSGDEDIAIDNIEVKGTPACDITNLAVASAATCSGNNATLNLCFDVEAGSGSYNVVNTATSAVIGTITGAAGCEKITGSVTVTGPTTAGNIMVKIVDAADATCESSAISVPIPSCPVVGCDIAGSAMATAPSCPGGMDGTITFSVTCTTCAGLEYSIDNGARWQMSPVFTGLVAGTYNVLARDTGDVSCVLPVAMVVVPAGVDTTDPTVATCPASPLTVNNDMGLCSAVVTYAVPTFNDNCDGMGLAGMMTAGMASGSTFPVGTTTVTFTYTDAAGNGPATCTFDVVVVDAEAPVATCMDATVFLDANGMGTVLPADVDGGSTDNCGITSEVVSPNMVDCNVITGGVTPPDDLVISGVYDGPLSGGVPKGIELFAINAIPDLSIYGLGSANNGGGSDGQEFTFPAVAVAAGTHIYVTSQAAGFTAFFGFAPDYVDGSMGINGDDAIELFKNGVVIDVFGDINVDGSGQAWEYTDGWAYRTSATGPDGSTFVIGNWTFSGRDALDGESTNAGATTPVPIGSYFYPLGTGMVDVNFTVTDAAGNSTTCTATVTVEDTITPMAICLPTFSIDLDVMGQAVLVGADIDNGSTDNCGVASLDVLPFQFTCADVGTPVTVTLTVTDIDGNTSTCTSDVTVNDPVAPVAICANPVACLDANGMASVTAADADGGSSDNCSVASISVSANSFTCADLMPLVPTQSLVISGVFDGPLPGGIPKGIELYVLQDIPDLSLYGVGFANNGGGTDGQEFTFPAVSANAGDYIYIATNAASFNTFFGFNPDFTTGSAAINGDDAIELFFNGAVIDIFGDINTDGTGQPWEYLDGWAYRVSATGPDGSTFVLGNFTYSGPNAFDGETDNGTAATPMPIGTYNFPALGGTGTVTLTVTDGQGTTSMCTANVLILDKLPPVANCQAASVTLDPNGIAILDGSIFDNGSTDNCGGALAFTVEPAEVNCDLVGTIEVTVTVTDESGNSADCTADLLVIASSACPPPPITNQGGPKIADPCTCLGNGFFAEEIVIGPAGSGQNWFISSTTLIDPATGNAFASGTPLTQIPDPANPGMFLYVIDGQHVDAVGYTLTASSPAFPGNDLTISNTCFYPDPLIGQVVGDFCLNTPPFTFTGTEARGAVGSGQFIFNGMLLPTTENPVGSGVWETTFDVAALGLGSYTMQFQFDAGNPPSAAPPANVGCVETIDFVFNVIETPSNIACNDNIQISLAENCEALITPDMILEGTYGCFDDYQVDILKGSRIISTSPMVTNSNIGQNLTTKVTHLISGTSCWGTINLEDKWAPEVNCGGPFVVDCTNGGIGSIAPAIGTDNCDPSPVVSLINEISNIDECGTSTYTRTYIATDIYGNTSRPCDQVIQITQADFTFPDDITWSCEQYAAFANVIDPTALHPLILAEAANMDQTLFCCIAGTDGDDVAGVDPYNPPATNILTNGGFEMGDFTDWTIVDAGCGDAPTIFTGVNFNNGLNNVSPTEGNSMSVNNFAGVPGGGCATITQRVNLSVPVSGLADFSFDYNAGWDLTACAGCAAKTATFQIINLSGGGLVFQDANFVEAIPGTMDPGLWQTYAVDLSPWAGDNLLIEIIQGLGPQPVPSPGHFAIDNAQLIAGSAVPYWLDGEDLDVTLDPLYNDDIDNPITDGDPACNTATAQTDELTNTANFSYMVGCPYLQDCDIAPPTAHAPEIVQVPIYLPPLAPPFGTNDIKRGLEDADVLAATGSGVPNVFGSDCPYAVTFDDEKLEACVDADMNVVFKILRTWTLLNWCTGQVFTDVQVIKVLDKKPPVLDFTDFDSDISANQTLGTSSHLDCSSNGIIGVPEIENNCSGISDIRLFTPAGPGIPVLDADGNTTGFQIPAPYLALGNHIVNFDVTDKCGNRATSTAVVRVLDDTPPAPICREFTEIGLTGSDLTQIPANYFDEGSYDQCAPVYFKIRRMEAFSCDNANVDDTRLGTEVDRRQEWFDDYTYFCCEDVGDTINVIMRVYDFDPGPRSIRTDRTTLQHTSSLDRRYNDCMVQVYISDKVRPSCIPPADVWANCTDYPANADYTDTDQLNDLFGSAIAQDNCNATIEELNPNVQVDLCGAGQIIRRFRAEDDQGNRSLGNCSQTIMIQSVIDYKLLVPGDFEEECDNASPRDFEYEEYACDLFAINSEDLELPASANGECKKIIRTWTLINWCEYDGVSDPVSIPRRDLNLDGRPGDGEGGSNNPVTGVRHSATHMYDYAGTVLVLNDNPLVVIPSGGYYIYDQHIKIFDNTAPDVSYSGDTEFCGGDLDEDPCTGEVDIAPTIDDMCTTTDHRWELTAFSSTFGNADFAGDGDLSGRYPLGTHTVRFYVSDECGNITEFDVTFEIVDCKAPTPVCHNGLSIDVMPASGMVELWAIDFDASSFDYCHPLKFRINRVEDRNGDGFITADDYLNNVPQFDSIQLTCANVGTLTNVQLWVGEESTDSQNNWDYCVTYVEVQDNNGACNGPRPTADAFGAIKMENNVAVGKVEVNLSGAASSMFETTDDGNYNFDNLFVGDDYSIAPYRNDDHTIGISTYDLVLISKHVLNVELLDSPYKIIAADVNRSNNVSTLDIVALRKIVLRVESEFANNTAWRFVDRDHIFSNPIKPWEGGIPEVVNYNNIEDVTNMANFVAIKIGDVSLDVNPNDVDGISPRTQGSIEFNAPDLDFKKGDFIEVPVTASELASIEGYQFTLEFDDKVLEFVDLKNGLASAENFGMSHLPKGKITTSWVASNSTPAFAEMFTLVFKAKQSGNIAESVEVNSSLTKAEGYSTEGQLLDVQLNFGSKAQVAEFKLHQNNPNPFDNQTVIAFELPQAASVTMTISDINGKVVYLKKGDFSKGTQTIQIKHSELSGSGVYYYQVDTGNDIATRKMILID